MDKIKFYFGAASGSAQKALRKLEEPNVMISYQTHNNQPWDEIESLFIDSGGYSLMIDEGEHPPATEYLEYVDNASADIFATQDYPCEPDILDTYGRSVQQHQSLSTEAACECIAKAKDMGITGQPMAVVQGWEVEDYPCHVDQLQAQGALTEYLGIGSVCRRGESDRIRRIIQAVDDATPPKTKLHAFGVKMDIAQYVDVRQSLYSADTTAWNFRIDKSWLDRWRTEAKCYLEYKEKLVATMATEYDQKTLTDTIQ